MALRPVLFAIAAIAALPAGAATPAPAPAPTAASKALPARPAARPVAKSARVLELDWKELLPEAERSHFTAVAPAPVHDSRGEGGPPAVQAQDFSVNKSLDGATVRLPGFIVPLEAVKSHGLSEFLLVPYFGSCIHVPPPPPNQIVYVHTSRRASLESIYDAYWITGKLRLLTKTTRLGATAYDLSAEKIEVYKY